MCCRLPRLFGLCKLVIWILDERRLIKHLKAYRQAHPELKLDDPRQFPPWPKLCLWCRCYPRCRKKGIFRYTDTPVSLCNFASVWYPGNSTGDGFDNRRYLLVPAANPLPAPARLQSVNMSGALPTGSHIFVRDFAGPSIRQPMPQIGIPGQYGWHFAGLDGNVSEEASEQRQHAGPPIGTAQVEQSSAKLSGEADDTDQLSFDSEVTPTAVLEARRALEQSVTRRSK